MPEAPPSEPPDSESTIMIPRPGGRRAAGAPAVAPPAPAVTADAGPAPPESALSAEVPPPVGTNPLLAHAAVLLNAVPTIRRTLNHRDPSSLRDSMLRAIADFEAGARRANASPEHVLIARYALCTMIDEAVANMPWGGTSAWARESLLVTLHKETFGGEKFFQLLDKALEDPRRNLDLLELMYACLALGFEGRFRIADNGRAQLDALRDRLYGVIRRERGEFERDLSPHWRGLQKTGKRFARRIPVWTALAAVALVLFVVYLVFALLLARSSDPIFSALAGIRADPGNLQRTVVATPALPGAVAPTITIAPLAVPRLRPLLTAEIQQGVLDVVEDADTSHVVIRGDSLYGPGGVDIKPTLVPVLDRIAEALNQVPGAITVTGHTDNVPTFKLRFPSNYELSVERARVVAAQLESKLKDRGRIKVVGVADSRPLVPNSTAEGRARNRRVEISLRAGS